MPSQMWHKLYSLQKILLLEPTCECLEISMIRKSKVSVIRECFLNFFPNSSVLLHIYQKDIGITWGGEGKGRGEDNHKHKQNNTPNKISKTKTNQGSLFHAETKHNFPHQHFIILDNLLSKHLNTWLEHSLQHSFSGKLFILHLTHFNKFLSVSLISH